MVSKKTYKETVVFDDIINSDKFTIIVILSSIIITIVLILEDVLNGLYYSLPWSILMIVSLLTGLYLYLKKQKFFLSTLLIVFFVNLGLTVIVYNGGLLTSSFLFFFCVNFGIPFILKNVNKYFSQALILFTITLLFSFVTLYVTPLFPTNPNITYEVFHGSAYVNSLACFIMAATYSFF